MQEYYLESLYKKALGEKARLNIENKCHSNIDNEELFAMMLEHHENTFLSKAISLCNKMFNSYLPERPVEEIRLFIARRCNLGINDVFEKSWDGSKEQLYEIANAMHDKKDFKLYAINNLNQEAVRIIEANVSAKILITEVNDLLTRYNELR